ncbi:DNA-binding protein [Saccharomonospora sp. NPDC046836]|uniref:helix-turn-helix transcriptional regulator n=1 Tax=Saccharomonospora sp. NPDC046836 TaxID=3156921 RepID=UPI0033E31B57
MTRQPAPTLEEIKANWPAVSRIPQACAALDISRSHGYELLKRGEFPCRVIKVGNSYRAITASLIEVLGGSAVAEEVA